MYIELNAAISFDLHDRVAADNILWEKHNSLILRDAALVFHKKFSQVFKYPISPVKIVLENDFSVKKTDDSLELYCIPWRLDHQSKIRSMTSSGQACTGLEKHIFFCLLAAGRWLHLFAILFILYDVGNLEPSSLMSMRTVRISPKPVLERLAVLAPSR